MGELGGGPHVAFLTHTPPLPAVSGERIRNWHLIRELSERGWRVSLFGLAHEGSAPAPEDVDRLRAVCDDVVLFPFPRRRQSRKVMLALALRRAVHGHMFASPESIAAGRTWLEQRRPDVVVVETHYMAPYVTEQLASRVLFDTHNSETRRIESMARRGGLSPRGIAARWQVRPVRRFEAEAAARAARIAVVSDEERSFFEELAPGRVDVVPNGVDCRQISARAAVPPGAAILFLGSLDYSPNVDAVETLVDEIAPLIERRDATITIVGSNPRPAVLRAAGRSTLTTSVAPNVPDTAPYWEAARCLVVPMRAGGGTRLKILESLAWGVPVVSTTLGCEGLGLADGRELLVADGPAAFADAVNRLLADPELCGELSSRGRQLVEERYDWRTIADAFERSVLSVLEAAGS
jgi:glycosyltransferase involved in cell wall biosynthesis